MRFDRTRLFLLCGLHSGRPLELGTEARVFRYVILGLLREGGACHGYALVQAYRSRSGVHAATGNFYRELQRLVRSDLITAVGGANGTGLRGATYRITPAGAAAFDAWFATASAGPPAQFDDVLSARALFLPEADVASGQKALNDWREAVWTRSRALERQRDALAQRDSHTSRCSWVLPILLERRRKHVAADLEFLDELRIAYEAWAAAAGTGPRPRRTTAVRSGRGRLPAGTLSRTAGK